MSDEEMLRKVAREFAAAPNLVLALGSVVRLIGEMTGASYVALYRKEKDPRVLRPQAVHDPNKGVKAPGSVRIGEGVFGEAAERGTPSWLDKDGYSWACAPVTVGSEVTGFILVANPNNSGPEFLASLEIISGFIGPSVRLREVRLEEQDMWSSQTASLQSRLDRLASQTLMIGKTEVMDKLRETISQIAQSNISVLITGESGTGKELVADLLHEFSDRREGPLVKVSCAALPESLAESELFGYAKGAFTGATTRKPGFFTRAHGGTIFLDEIGELSLPIQAKLLRVVQEKKFEEIGGTTTQSVDVRILAATNQDLSAAVRQGTFRQDLFYRINAFPIRVPPLRERLEDLPLLAMHFLRDFTRANKKGPEKIEHKALAKLMSHDWPGNVRELQAVMARAALTSQGPGIEITDLMFDVVSTQESHRLPETNSLSEAVERVERELIVRVLKETQGSRGESAQKLQTTLRILNYKIRKYGLDTRHFKPTVGSQG